MTRKTLFFHFTSCPSMKNKNKNEKLRMANLCSTCKWKKTALKYIHLISDSERCLIYKDISDIQNSHMN